MITLPRNIAQLIIASRASTVQEFPIILRGRDIN